MECADIFKDGDREERLLVIVYVYRHQKYHLEVQLAWIILTLREVGTSKTRETEETKSEVRDNSSSSSSSNCSTNCNRTKICSVDLKRDLEVVFLDLYSV